ncbi:hypothetical protein EST38_g8633 [Candolleomyces aberdarensis]|uniref:Extracellular metalloproteinase n=1 Tax=Candolleomyces aberdarensis TaxID=2316362 RepID=A0A4Q2DC59_9AGAR|nr:hypothetical protein EST38_g8633 [Candolleomyces aberdarensis]
MKYSCPRQSIVSHSASDLVFDYTYRTSQASSTPNNVNSANANFINAVYAITYQYGFTEAASYFQTLEG